MFYFPNRVTQCTPRRVTRKFWFPFIPGERSTAKDTLHWFVWILCSVGRFLTCENIRFSSPFTAGDVSRETSPAAKNEMEKRMFSQAGRFYPTSFPGPFPTRPPEGSNWRGHPDLCFTHQALNHFRVTPGLCIKTRLSAQPLIRKWVFILLHIEIIFTRKDVPFKTRKWPITVTPVEELFKERILILYFKLLITFQRFSKISWFVCGEQINYLPKPKAEANNWSVSHWQITIFCDNRVQ